MKFLLNNFTHRVLLTLLILINGLFAFGQNEQVLKWWNPVDNSNVTIVGQAWTGETESPFDRLPARAKKIVRKPVWNLSHNSAGLVIRFRTNAREITIEYGVSGSFAMTHMPATGVSGVDLYSIDKNNTWLWCAGKRSFGDTVRYTFSGIEYDSESRKNGIEYRLYLPLYNSVKWLRIGVSEEAEITTMPVCYKKPVVVYGTSIAQGACASRPGMAWTAQVGRKLNLPVINLGFSGEGKLDKDMIELIAEIDAEIYVLDCMPNMTAPRFTNEQVKERVIAAVNYLQKKHPQTPILLTEHDGYSDEEMRPGRFKNYNDINIVLRNTFKDMKKAGIENIFLLPHSKIGMDIDSQVDGIHANDWGMFKYARAYSEYINVILGL